jgi:hypothetical protein
MKYIVEMGLRFHGMHTKIGSDIPKLMGRYTNTQT